jgi:hypothetical protein
LFLNKNCDREITAKILLTRKLKYWKYEEEYRVLHTEEYFNDFKITGILLGLKVSELFKKAIKQLSPKDLPIWETEIKIGEDDVPLIVKKSMLKIDNFDF